MDISSTTTTTWTMPAEQAETFADVLAAVHDYVYSHKGSSDLKVLEGRISSAMEGGAAGHLAETALQIAARRRELDERTSRRRSET